MREDAIGVVAYDADWPRSFERERRVLEPVLTPALVRPVEHIGSTAVPGLAAKPIIDMLAVVSNIDDAAEVAYFDGTDWVASPEADDLQDRRLSFCAPTVQRRTHHLHIVEEASSSWREWIVFRDYLRSHPEVATEYEVLKRSLADAHGHDANDRAAYRSGKTSFVEGVVAVARSEGPT